jgi:hypothetical protein
MRTPTTSENFAERFWAKVEVGDDCWLWAGAHNGHGHGRIVRPGGVRVYVHRVSWEFANGRAVPEGMNVCHRCDVPACVNPEHLFVGTQRDNMQDASAKGRTVNRNTHKTHCARGGHPLSGDNLYVYNGQRTCKICRREACRRSYYARKVAA